MSHLLEQAHSAAQQENWQFVNQCLQELATSQPLNGISPASTVSEAERSRFFGGSSILSLALAVLEAGDFQERWEVAKMFKQIGTQAIAPLLGILQDDCADLELRWFAVRILADFDRPEVVEALIGFLHSQEDRELQDMAASALAMMGETAIAPLSDRLSADESRQLAVRSLAQIRSPHVIEPLLSVVNDRNSQVRSAALEALNGYDDPRILPVLLQAVNDIAAEVRREATIGLGLYAMRPSSCGDRSTLATVLRDRLWDFNLTVCEQAAIALARVGTASAALALFEVLESRATPIPLQISAIRALGWMETADALRYLHQALLRRQAEPDGMETVVEIVSAIAQIEAPPLRSQAAQLSIDVLQTHPTPPALTHPQVKQAIALGLARLGDPQALEPLIQLLAEPDTAVRLHAIAALKQLAPTAAYDRLAQLDRSTHLSPQLQQGVAIALSEWRSHG